MKVAPSAPLRFFMSPLDMSDRSAMSRFSSLRGLAGGQPAGTFTAWPPYMAAAATAAANGYSTPYNAVPAGAGSAMMLVNPDTSYSYVFDWINYPPLNVWPGETAGPGQSFKLPPQSVWNAAVVALGLASLADLQAANNAAAVAAAQQSCGATGGTWNPANNTCGVAASAPATLSAQQACLQQGKSWDPSTGACYVPPVVTTTPPPVTTTGAPPTPGAGTLAFTSSRGGSQFQPGDTWRITISGAAPNSPVSVFGIHPDGSQATSVLGSTDAQGNYSLTGAFGPADHGTWQETWYVGSQQVGSPFSFTVSSTSSSSSTTGAGTGPTGGSGVPGGSGGSTQQQPVVAGVPNNYLILGAVGLAVLLLLGRR